LCLARGAYEKANKSGSQTLTEDLLPDGTYSIRVKHFSRADPRFSLERISKSIKPADLSQVPPTEYSTTEVGLPVFETVEYGLACGFEFLGAQAQLLLDNIGRGTVEFLREELHVKLPSSYRKSLIKLAEFYVKEGLADKIDVDLSGSDIKFRFSNYRYGPVLKHLLEEGHPLTSCPFVLAARGIFRDNGLVVSNLMWTLGKDLDASLTLRLRNISDQVFDEEKVASLMESV
jgi:hypothetical protein